MGFGIGKIGKKRLAFLIGLPALIWLAGCGVSPDFILTVNLGEGVSGTPEAGRHIFKEFTQVSYTYKADNPAHTVEVMFNNRIRNEGSGSIVMYGDGYQIDARVIDIRGDWKVTLKYTDASIAAPDPFRITISGPDLLSGIFRDERGYNGTWTAAGNVLRLVYFDWGFYVLSGTVFGMGTESGGFTGEGLTGIWSAERTS